MLSLNSACVVLARHRFPGRSGRWSFFGTAGFRLSAPHMLILVVSRLAPWNAEQKITS